MTGAWLDAYDRRSRLQPALLSTLPFALSIVPLVGGLSALWTVTAPLLVFCGGTYFLAQIARGCGKQIEPELYRSWGGPPTTRLLRHRDARNPVMVEHHHAQLARLLPDLQFPSAAEEAADPVHADDVYEAAVAYLREATRDRATFPLVFAENCNYGFRRNLLGLRPQGILATLVGLGFVVGAILLLGPAIALVGAATLDVVAVALWLAVVSPSWVKAAADAFAERLLGAANQLKSA